MTHPSKILRGNVRDLFPVTRNLTYLNHAAVGPLSTHAYEAMERHARDQRDYGALHWRDWYAEYDRVRELAARLIGGQPQEIAILKNTSEGLSFVAEGYRWESGDNVVVTDLEFPSNYTPWKRLTRKGVECRVVRSRNGAYDPDDVERLIDERTKILSISSVAFHNGFTADLEAIGAICAKRGVLFCVDAIQSLGALPIDVRKANIAFLAADAHKWLCGPEGATIFFIAKEHLDAIEPIESGWMNIDRKNRFIGCDTDLLPNARRFEAGSMNTNGIYGLGAALDLLLEVGINNIANEVIRLSTKLADDLESLGFGIGTPRPVRSGIVGATPPDVEPRKLLRFHLELEKERIICAPREGMLRFSPHFYNDESDLQRVIDVLRGLAA